MWVLTGVWSFGDYKTKPLTFNNTNIIINWSYNELKLEIYGDANSNVTLLNFYELLHLYGEWGENLTKPIVWMKVETPNKMIKSKNHIDKEKIAKFIDNDYFKITIYYETTIQESPFSKDYITSNAYWIYCIGGLYYVADLYLYLENGNDIIEPELHKNNCNKTPFNVKNYNNEDLYEYSLETWETAKELVKLSRKWELFKYNYHN